MTEKEALQIHINIGMLVGSAHRAMTKRFVQNTHKMGLDISLDQWMVLGPIWKFEGTSQKDIAEFCLKDKTSITRIINTLEKMNLGVRVPDQIDHRIKRVVLTHHGKQLFQDVLPVMEKTREEVRQGISDKEIETLKKVLTRITYNLENDNS